MFWENLTEGQADEYYYLSKLIQRWAGWCSERDTFVGLSPKKRQELLNIEPDYEANLMTRMPSAPTNGEFWAAELLAMTGWKMLPFVSEQWERT